MAGKRLGALGTLVRDTIHLDSSEREPGAGWGGMAYGLEALEVALPEEWEVVPLVRVGADLEAEARAYLMGFRRVRSLAGVQVVPEPTNRVEIHYRRDGSRRERLSGGVPPWPPEEAAARTRELDALYVNFISGFELDPAGAEAIRNAHAGPIYADLHSLFLSVDTEGYRWPQPLAQRDRWLRSFDAIQVNEDEFRLLAAGEGDPWVLAARKARSLLRLVAVTLGSRGAGAIVRETEAAQPLAWRRSATYREGERLVRRFAPARGVAGEGGRPGATDPTGCGDVWGATFFARLLAGDGQRQALNEANRLAGRAATVQGAEGLRRGVSGTDTDSTSGSGAEIPGDPGGRRR